MLTLLIIISAPDRPTVTSQTNAPVLSVNRAQVAVPVASAFASSVNAENVNTPDDAEGAHGSEHVTVPSRVVTAPPVVGFDPL